MRMEVRPALQRGFRHGPVHKYHVAFWRQPRVPPENLPQGVTHERVVWAASEYDVYEAVDLLEALDWANSEARERQSIFTIYAVIERGGREGMVWLAGWDPTASSRPNFSRRQPPEVDPVSGTPLDVYGPRSDGGDTDHPPLV